MNLYAKLIISLSLFSGVAAGLLSLTFGITKPLIERRDREDRQNALKKVFFLQNEGGDFKLRPRELADGVTLLFEPEKTDQPLYYAVAGEGGGYNSSVPVTLMVGFTGPGGEAGKLLQGYAPPEKLPPAGAKGRYLVGFSVVNSEETPGLGEKIKDSRPPYTWKQFFFGDLPPASPDTSTPFQRQFRGRTAESLQLKKNGGDLDAVTAATITTRGVLAAIRDAEEKLEATLSGSKQ
ncbi:MAG: FMN-binding protein [Planctomycetota bacterium]|jgi:RnfABCDGE-type electron transport complex G subunit|nr:FMN-binding protein [Planctomycetota bacterium]